MDCERYEAILSRETGPALARALEEHCRGCASCARRPPEEQALLLAMTASLEAVLRVEPSAGFLASVRERVADERAWPSRPPRAWLTGVAATVAILVALFAATARWRARVEEARPPVADGPARAGAASPGPVTAAPAVSPLERPRKRPGNAPVRSPRPRPVFEADVIVEPGQDEALARLARGLAGLRPRSASAVASLDPEVPLPRLQPLEPPRFEMKPLHPPPAGWGPALDDGSGRGTDEDTALDTEKGSDS
jgi:hypothetical protein